MRVMVNVGDTIARDQPVLELETDKATIEVPSSVAGTVKEVRVKKGDKIKVGAVVLTVDDPSAAGNGAGAAAGKPAAKADARTSEKASEAPAEKSDTTAAEKAESKPAADHKVLAMPPRASSVETGRDAQQPPAAAPRAEA